MIERVTDHAERAVERLPMQHRRPNWERFIRVLAGRFQELEDVFFDLLEKRLLDSAEGVYLDALGEIVGAERGGMDDNDFRLRVKVAIRASKGAGTGDDVLEIFRMLVGAGNTLRLTEYPPAAFELRVGDELPFDAGEGLELLRRIRAGGVRAQLVWTETGDDNTFTLDGTPEQGLDTGLLAGVGE